jgi:hypothetical protein
MKKIVGTALVSPYRERLIDVVDKTKCGENSANGAKVSATINELLLILDEIHERLNKLEIICSPPSSTNM